MFKIYKIKYFEYNNIFYIFYKENINRHISYIDKHQILNQILYIMKRENPFKMSAMNSLQVH